MRIEIGRFYKTRDGKKVRIYALDGYMDDAIHGAIYEDLEVPILRLQGWNFEGHVVSQELHEDNIVDEWKEI